MASFEAFLFFPGLFIKLLRIEIGNEALLSFPKAIEGKNFSFKEVKRDLGETGERLVTYLFNRGLIKICNLK